jgi:prepilin-type N-terminal cleavage/methylation domain-containing protein
MRRTSSAFTLIELLVVVSIIALLISILIPSLKTARETARSAVCRANLRQVGVGLSAYASSNADYIPTAYHPGSTNNNRDWHVALGSSGVLGSAVTYLGLGHSTEADILIKGWLSFSCPSETGCPASTNEPYFRWFNGRGHGEDESGDHARTHEARDQGCQRVLADRADPQRTEDHGDREGRRGGPADPEVHADDHHGQVHDDRGGLEVGIPRQRGGLTGSQRRHRSRFNRHRARLGDGGGASAGTGTYR